MGLKISIDIQATQDLDNGDVGEFMRWVEEQVHAKVSAALRENEPHSCPVIAGYRYTNIRVEWD